jgi:hypothetical protein
MYPLSCGMALFLLSFVLGFLPLVYSLVLFSKFCCYPIHNLPTNCKLMADRIVLGSGGRGEKSIDGRVWNYVSDVPINVNRLHVSFGGFELHRYGV